MRHSNLVLTHVYGLLAAPTLAMTAGDDPITEIRQDTGIGAMISPGG